MEDKVRADKWLWAVRLFKTRSLAAEACEKGRVRCGEQVIKAGRALKVGETLIIHRGPWHQTVKVLSLTQKRLGASLVSEYVSDHTPKEELDKWNAYLAARAGWNLRQGAGRPTKKDRRDMDEYMDEF